MKLRPASQSDFECFARLYEDLDAEQIYAFCDSDESSDDSSCYFDDAYLEAIKYKEKEFQYDILHQNILLIVHEEQVIGYFRFFRITPQRYKLADWTLEKNYQELKEVAWRAFLHYFSMHHKRVREIEVCIPLFASTISWFISHGFASSSDFFFKLHLHQNRKEGSV